MNQDLQNFIESLKTDKALQEKMETAAKNYTGDKTQEAVLRDLIIPVAKEAGFSLTVEEFKSYESGMVKDIDLDEMDQVAGGGSTRGGGGVGIGGTFGCDNLG